MFAVLIALVLLAAAIGAIYLILKNMGEGGIEIAVPGSCKSGRCGVRCAPAAEGQVGQENEPLDDVERQKEAA